MNSASALRSAMDRINWATRRSARVLLRRLGMAGLLTLLFATVTLVAWWSARQSESALTLLSDRRAELVARPAAKTLPMVDDDASRIADFHRYLVAAEDIPAVVQDLIGLAQQQGLRLHRGDYRVQADAQGGFLRYRMILPVRGSAKAVHGFMLAALGANKTLALESVQFKRDQIASDQIEARIQWTLLARLPERHGVLLSEAKP